MINGLFFGATGNGRIKPMIQWTAVANTEGNYSDVTATLSYTRTNYGYTTYGHWAGSLTIAGDRKYLDGVYAEITDAGYTPVITHTVRVYHADDGTKTITISADGGIADTTLTYTSIAGEIKLEDIPRAAAISATDAAIGDVSTVHVEKTSERYSHTVAYRFGALTGYLTREGIADTPQMLTEAVLSFRLPESFYYEIPDAMSGECILTCTTYLAGQVIGEPQVTAFTVRTDPAKCAPLLTAQADDQNPVTLALTGDGRVAVRYASRMVCRMTGQSRFGASVVEKKIAGVTVTEDTLTLEGYDAESIRFSVRDSRGYVTETVLSPERVLYHPPTGILTVKRTDATSGKAALQLGGSFFSGSFGASDNTLQLRYRVGGGSWTELAAVAEGSDYTASAQLTGLVYTNAYRIEVEIRDALSTQLLQTTVNPGVPVFDWGRSDFRFCVPVTAPRVTGLTAPASESDAANQAYVDAKVSEAEAAGKQYADTKISMTLLWENASPTSDFPEQRLSLPLEQSSAVVIHYKHYRTNEAVWSMLCPVGKVSCLQSIYGDAFLVGNIQNAIRHASVEKTGITFSGGFVSTSGGALASHSGVCVPVSIYVIKGVSA